VVGVATGSGWNVRDVAYRFAAIGAISCFISIICATVCSHLLYTKISNVLKTKKIINLSRLGRHDSLAPLWVRHWLINDCRCASFHRGSAVCIAVSDVTFLSIDGLCKADKLARFSHLPSLIFGGGASLRLGHSVQQLFTRHEEMKSSNLSLALAAGSHSFACDLYLLYLVANSSTARCYTISSVSTSYYFLWYKLLVKLLISKHHSVHGSLTRSRIHCINLIRGSWFVY